MRYKNPYDSGWRAALLWGALALFTIAAVYFLKMRPKLEICGAYYPEISTYTCLVSDYALPPRSKP